MLDDKDVELDTEGLRKHYDVVLAGTGLTQAILASALARAGKSVLHLDWVDHYGGLEAVWSLSQLQALYETERNNTAAAANDNSESSTFDDTKSFHTNGELQHLQIHSLERPTAVPISCGTEVATPFGIGKVHTTIIQKNKEYSSVAIHLDESSAVNHSSTILYVGIDTTEATVTSDSQAAAASGLLLLDPDYMWGNHKIRSLQAETASQVLHEHSRKLAFDVTPGMLYASGTAVKGLLDSGVSEYLEFKSLEGMMYAATSTKNVSSTAKKQILPVPCSKNDVFASKLLSPMDKRRLMKFLQTALDYATADTLQQEEIEAAKQQQQELEDAAAASASMEELQSWNERHLNMGRSLSRPQNKAVASSEMEKLQSICEENTMTLEEYLLNQQRLSEPLSALVRYALAMETGENPLSVRDGMKQLCEHMSALGRFGGTAFLVPMYGSGELSQAFCRSGAVYGGTYLLRRAVTAASVDQDGNVLVEIEGGLEDDCKSSGKKKTIVCSKFIAPQEATVQSSDSSNTRRVLRRISLLRGKPLLQLEGYDVLQHQQRHTVILPPGSIEEQTSTIQCLFIDDTVNVAPIVRDGCTMLHLTTTIDASVVTDPVALMDSAVKFVLNGICNGDQETGEIFSTTFSFRQEHRTTTSTDNGPIFITKRPCPAFALDPYFEDARRIFHEICPGYEFLKISTEMEEVITERLGDNHDNKQDDEKLVLESAVDMIESKAATSATTASAEEQL